MFGLNVVKNSEVPITSQLIRQLREFIQCGKIQSGYKMPPTRSLAQELNISRNTVIQAYEQLIAEGYLDSIVGSGTFVAEVGVIPKSNKSVATIGESIIQDIKSGIIAFEAGNPDTSVFPRILWAKAFKEACLEAQDNDFGYGRLKGHPLLREALCRYLFRSKGIFCDSGRIIIVPGTAVGMDIIAQMLFEKGSAVAVEDPSLLFARHAITKSGYKVLPVESDNCGICIDRLPTDSSVGLICVAPSHQYPLGGVLPASRRIALLNYAQKNDAYIIEDDYDSEFRYQGEPIQSLWHLNNDRVIYLGSFSNIFTPSLRMAYMILPEHLMQRTLDMMGKLNVWVGAIEQIALARLMDSKQFDRHIYRMKKLYDAKRKYLINVLKEQFGDSIIISGENAGLHLLVTFNRDLTDKDFKAMAENDVDVDYVEDYAVHKGSHRNQIVLGYGNLSFAQIEEGVSRLKKSLEA